jgi:hypothetical protein
MLLSYLRLPITVTFSTPTGVYTHYLYVGIALMDPVRTQDTA